MSLFKINIYCYVVPSNLKLVLEIGLSQSPLNPYFDKLAIDNSRIIIWMQNTFGETFSRFTFNVSCFLGSSQLFALFCIWKRTLVGWLIFHKFYSLSGFLCLLLFSRKTDANFEFISKNVLSGIILYLVIFIYLLNEFTHFKLFENTIDRNQNIC